MTAVGTAVAGDLSTFSIAALPGLPKGRFNISHAQLYQLFQQITQIAARLETPSAMHLNVSAYSNAIPMLTWLIQAELHTVIYGIPNVPLPTDRRLIPRPLHQGTPLSREWFVIVHCDQWQIMLHALPTANGQFACLLTQKLDVITAAVAALGANNRLTARAAQMTRVRDEATVRLLWRFAEILPDANQIVAGLGTLALPYGLAMVLINREKDRWALMTQAVQRILTDTRLVIYRLDSRAGMLQPFENTRPLAALSLQADRLVNRAVLGDLPLFGQENGGAVAAIPIAIISKTWGIAEFSRPQPFTALDQTQIGLLTALIGITLTELGDMTPNQQSMLDESPIAATLPARPMAITTPAPMSGFKTDAPKALPGSFEHPEHSVPLAHDSALHLGSSMRSPSKLAVAEIPAMTNEVQLANAQAPDELDTLDTFSDFSFSASSDSVYWPDLDDFTRADDTNESLTAQRISNGRDLMDASRPLSMEIDLDRVRPASIELLAEPATLPPQPPLMSLMPLIPYDAPSVPVVTDHERLAFELLKAPTYNPNQDEPWADTIPAFAPLPGIDAAPDLSAGFNSLSFTPVPITSDQQDQQYKQAEESDRLDVLDPFSDTAPAAIPMAIISRASATKDFDTTNVSTEDLAFELTNDPFFVPPPLASDQPADRYATAWPEIPPAFATSFDPPFNLGVAAPTDALNTYAPRSSDFVDDDMFATAEALPIIAPLPDMAIPTFEPNAPLVDGADWILDAAPAEPNPAPAPEMFFAVAQIPIDAPLSTIIPVTTPALPTPAPTLPPAPAAINRLPVSPMLNDMRLFLSRLRERVSRLPQVKSGFNATQTHLVAQVVSDVNSAIDALGDMALVADLSERLTHDAAWHRVDFGSVLQSLYVELKETSARRGLRLDWKPTQETYYVYGTEELLTQCGRALIGGLLELTTTGTVAIRLTHTAQSLALTVTVPRSEALPKQSSAILPGFDQINPKRNRLAVAKAILDYHSGDLLVSTNTAATVDFIATLPLAQR